MKLRQQARVLKRKALTSFITAAEAFNSPRDDGRVTTVLLLWVPKTCATWANALRNAVGSVKRSASARPEVG